jgi:hypothetical protein
MPAGPGRNNPNRHIDDPNGDPDVEVTLDILIAAAAYSIATGKAASIRIYWASNSDQTGAPWRWPSARLQPTVATFVSVTVKSAPDYARNRQANTLETGTLSRSKPAPDYAAIRQGSEGIRGTHLQRFSASRGRMY